MSEEEEDKPVTSMIRDLKTQIDDELTFTHGFLLGVFFTMGLLLFIALTRYVFTG